MRALLPNRISVFVAAFCAFTSSTLAQLSQPERMEIPLGQSENYFIVAPLGKEGLMLFREASVRSAEGKSQVWEVVKLDTTFQESWGNSYLIERKYSYAFHKPYKNAVHVLFTDEASGNRDLLLLIINIETSEVIAHEIKNYIPFGLAMFEVFDRGILLGGYFNYRPLVIMYNFQMRRPLILPGVWDQKGELVQMLANGSVFDVIVSGKTFDKKKTLFLRTFDENGTLLQNVTLDPERRKQLIFGRTVPTNTELQVVAGVYGRGSTEYSRGLFISSINPYGEHAINYYNYADLTNFFSYMKARREARIKRRIERRTIKDKKIRFNYRLLVHNIIRNGDQYVLLGEAFYPKYRSFTQGTDHNAMWAFGGGSYEMNRIFDGFRYTHAVVVGFDTDGNILWDNSFEINDVVSFELDQFVNVIVDDDRVVLLYVYDNVIRSKIIQGNEVLEGKNTDEIRLKFQQDILKRNDEDVGGLAHWYDNVFFAYGAQTIENIAGEGISVDREVFFINKVVYK